MSILNPKPLDKRDKIIAAARETFFRYGFRRVTMGDLADASRISRPALYLAFPSKEAVFAAVVESHIRQSLGEIRAGLARFDHPSGKLNFAFEIWAVKTFETIRALPDSKELVRCSEGAACGLADQAIADFNTILTGILAPLFPKASQANLSADQLARMLTNAAHGFTESAQSSDELRQMISGLISIVLAGLDSVAAATKPAAKPVKKPAKRPLKARR